MLKARGFTLIEIMVALFIFAILSVLAITGLQTVIKAREQTEIAEARLAELQLAFSLLTKDLQQAMPRLITDNNGLLQAAVVANNHSLTLTHGGFINPSAIFRRSTLQRVTYFYQGTQFIRRTWPVIDQAPQTQAVQRVLLDAIDDLQIRLYDDQLRTYTSWPVNQQGQLPRAIEMTLKLHEGGSIRRIFKLPS